MSTIPDFTIFTVRAAESGIRVGVAETLRADQEVAHFLGATLSGMAYGTDGRIYETPTTLIPDGPLPACYVYVVRASREIQLSREVIVTATIGVSLVWDEYRDQLGSGARTCEDFFNRVHAKLCADPGLEACPSGQSTGTGKGLADRLEGSETQDFTYGPSKEPDYVTVERACLFNYRVTVNATTGTPQ